MMRRDDYKAVKRMDKAQMENYLQTIYRRGYEAGVKAAAEREKDAVQSNPDGVTPEAEG